MSEEDFKNELEAFFEGYKGVTNEKQMSRIISDFVMEYLKDSISKEMEKNPNKNMSAVIREKSAMVSKYLGPKFSTTKGKEMPGLTKEIENFSKNVEHKLDAPDMIAKQELYVQALKELQQIHRQQIEQTKEHARIQHEAMLQEERRRKEEEKEKAAKKDGALDQIAFFLMPPGWQEIMREQKDRDQSRSPNAVRLIKAMSMEISSGEGDHGFKAPPTPGMKEIRAEKAAIQSNFDPTFYTKKR